MQKTPLIFPFFRGKTQIFLIFNAQKSGMPPFLTGKIWEFSNFGGFKGTGIPGILEILGNFGISGIPGQNLHFHGKKF